VIQFGTTIYDDRKLMHVEAYMAVWRPVCFKNWLIYVQIMVFF